MRGVEHRQFGSSPGGKQFSDMRFGFGVIASSFSAAPMFEDIDSLLNVNHQKGGVCTELSYHNLLPLDSHGQDVVCEELIVHFQKLVRREEDGA